MSRRQYRAFAEALKFERPTATGHEITDTAARLAWRACVVAVADVCAADNGRFDRGRFYAACGIPEGAR